MYSLASPPIPPTGSMSCCPGTGRRQLSNLRSGGLMGHVNKVNHVITITHVAEMLGEDEEWLCDVAEEMDTEDGASGSLASEKTA